MGQLVRISAKRDSGLQGVQMVEERRRSQILNLFWAWNDGLYVVCEKKKSGRKMQTSEALYLGS